MTGDWRGSLWLGAGNVLYAGPGGDAGLHSHLAIQAIATTGDGFSLSGPFGRLEAKAALLPSGVPHELSCPSEPIVLMLLEPHGPMGAALAALAGEGRPEELSPDAAAGLAAAAQAPDPEVAAASGLRAILPGAPSLPPISRHVRRALDHVERELASGPRLTAAAEEAAVSPSRLSHLFTAEVGIPFRRFVLWRRLRSVAERVAGGDNLTRAAVEAGFSDSAHLSRSFRSTFGLSPSALLAMRSIGRWPGD